MKKYILGLILMITGSLSLGIVSYAADDPPTEICELNDHYILSIDTNSATLIVTFEIPATRLVGDTELLNIEKDTLKNSKDFALYSSFDWEPYNPPIYGRYNEWMIYKYELNFTNYLQNTITQNRLNERMNC